MFLSCELLRGPRHRAAGIAYLLGAPPSAFPRQEGTASGVLHLIAPIRFPITIASAAATYVRLYLPFVLGQGKIPYFT